MCDAPHVPRGPRCVCEQLRRRAGIPTTQEDDDTLAAFNAAVQEHEARLQVQYAGGVGGARPARRRRCMQHSAGRGLPYGPFALGAAAEHYGEQYDRGELNEAFAQSALA